MSRTSNDSRETIVRIDHAEGAVYVSTSEAHVAKRLEKLGWTVIPTDWERAPEGSHGKPRWWTASPVEDTSAVKFQRLVGGKRKKRVGNRAGKPFARRADAELGVPGEPAAEDKG